MNKQNRNLCAYAAMAIALLLSPLTVYGQAYTSPATNSTTSSQTTEAADRDGRRQEHNYGWIGLLGLLGLTGLMRKRDRSNRVEYSDHRSMAGSRR